MNTAAWLTVYLVLRVAFVIVLYGILFVVLWHVYREIGFGRNRQPLAQLRPLAESSHQGQHTHLWLPLKAHTTIGSRQGNDIVLNDPHISAEHAILHWQQGVWTLIDTSSHTATFVNGQRCKQPMVVPLRNQIQLGALRFELVTT